MAASPLPGFLDGPGFLDLADRHARAAAGTGASFALVVAKLECPGGDCETCIHMAAAVLLQTFRESDIVTRLGEGDLVVLLPNVPMDAADMLRKRLDESIDAFNAYEGADSRLSMRTAIACFDPAAPNTAHELLAAALRSLGH